MQPIIRLSLARIAPQWKDYEIRRLPKAEWETGDYVVAAVNEPPAMDAFVELANGRMAITGLGDRLLGALGVRFATLEATGSWEAVGPDGRMCAMTGAGLFGRITSASPFVAPMVRVRYQGHVLVAAEKQKMADFAVRAEPRPFNTPVLLIVGSSMSAGKTNSARIIIRRLKTMGLRVLAAKLTGAGRYRDVLSMGDAGADWIFDFVDAGMPSTVCDPDVFEAAARNLLSRMAELPADIAVIEAGASPLEPYNGDAATRLLEPNIRMMLLCASDPYSVLGITEAFGRKADLVAGIACNTDAGAVLIHRLTGLNGLRLIDDQAIPRLDLILKERFDIA